MAQKEIRFETQSLERLLNKIGAAVKAFNVASPIIVDAEAGRDRANNPEKAALARQTLHAAELANLLASELHVRFWQLKGEDDPRTQPSTDLSEGVAA